jgi:DNA-binding NtrC family response regulator
LTSGGRRLDRTILVIDDDLNIRRTFERILRRNGYVTDTASTGKEALQRIKSKHYEVVLVDLCLPDINGICLLEELYLQDHKMIRIVITGSQYSSLDKVKIADACLLKPVKPQELLSFIEQKIKEKTV